MSNVVLLKRLEGIVKNLFMMGYSKKFISEQLEVPRENVDQIIQETFGIKPRKQGEKNDNN